MKLKKLLLSTLSVSILFSGLASPAFANSINTNSGFYRSKRTRNAYINLTAGQRQELDAMNTNNNSQLTIKEVKNYGKYRLPIVKGQSYLYPFMDDRNNNGMVGENDKDAISSSNTGTVENVAAIDEEITNNDDQINELVDEMIEENEVDDSNELEKNPSEENIESPIIDTGLSEESLDRLEESVKNAKQTIAGAEILIQTMPKFAKEHGDVINKLIQEQINRVERGEAILRSNGR